MNGVRGYGGLICSSEAVPWAVDRDSSILIEFTLKILIRATRRCGPVSTSQASGGLLTRDVEVQAAACRD